MYEMLVEGRRSDFQVVRTMEEAEALIGLGPLNFSRALQCCASVDESRTVAAFEFNEQQPSHRHDWRRCVRQLDRT